MDLSLLTDYEKAHLPERQLLPEHYLGLGDEELDRRIRQSKQRAEAAARKALRLFGFTTVG